MFVVVYSFLDNFQIMRWEFYFFVIKASMWIRIRQWFIWINWLHVTECYFCVVPLLPVEIHKTHLRKCDSVNVSVNVRISRETRLWPSVLLWNMWMRAGALSRGALVFFLSMNHSVTPVQKRLSWHMKCKWSQKKPVRCLKHLFLEFFFFSVFFWFVCFFSTVIIQNIFQRSIH